LLEERGAIRLEVLAVCQRSLGIGQKRLKDILAVDQRGVAQIHPIQIEKIEDVIDEALHALLWKSGIRAFVLVTLVSIFLLSKCDATNCVSIPA